MSVLQKVFWILLLSALLPPDVRAGAPAGADWFPDKANLLYARGFQVEYRGNYKLVTLTLPWKDASDSIRYLLVQRGTDAPQAVEADQVFEIPCRRIVSLSTTYLTFLDDQGLTSQVIGQGGLKWVNNPSLRRRIEDGEVLETGQGAAVNLELLLTLQPDLVMVHVSGDPQSGAYGRLGRSGLPIAVNGEHLEAHPLGRAEWGKFIALFFNTEAGAERIFDELVERYSELKRKAAAAPTRPLVLTGAASKGVWWVPEGGSYVAALIEDAAGRHLLSRGVSPGSRALSFEAVLEAASDADFWIDPAHPWDSLGDAAASDPRNSLFEAFQQGRIYNNNARLSPGGGNDYWESGVARPDRLLADLIRIFHPGLLPQHRLVYYRRLDGEAGKEK